MSDMHVDYEGTHYDVGAAEVDLNNNGHDETSVIYSDNQVEYYTDNNGDGQADELTITDYSGNLVSHEESTDGVDWHETGTAGTIGADAIGRATSDVASEGHYYPASGVDNTDESDYSASSSAPSASDTTGSDTSSSSGTAQYNDGTTDSQGYTDTWSADQGHGVAEYNDGTTNADGYTDSWGEDQNG